MTEARIPAALRRAYFVFFFAFGSYQPFLNLHFKQIGLSGSQIGLMAAIWPAASFLAPPLFGSLADARGRIGRTTAGLMIAAAFPFALMPGLSGFWALLPALIAFALTISPVMPLLDTAAVTAASAGDLRNSYGRIRRFGSLGYMAGVIVLGQLAERLGLGYALYATPVALVAGGLMTARLGDTRSPNTTRERPSGLSQLFAHLRRAAAGVWRNRPLRLFYVAGGLAQLGAISYNAFFAIYAHDLGISDGWIGILLAVAVTSEVGVLSLAHRIEARIGAFGLFALGVAGQLVRWSAMALAANLWLIVALQLLHGLTFAAFWAGAVGVVQKWTDPGSRASGQALWAAVSRGLAGAAGTLIAGRIYDAFGVRTLFWCAAGMAAAALVLAGWVGLDGSLQRRSLAQRGKTL